MKKKVEKFCRINDEKLEKDIQDLEEYVRILEEHLKSVKDPLKYKTGSGSTSDDPRSEADETVEPRMNLMKQQPLFFFVRFRGTFVERSFKLREALSFQ